MMNSFFRCVSAEILKSRRTLSLLGVFLLPTMLTLFNFLLLSGIERSEDWYSHPDGWVSFEHNTITFWALLFFPYGLVLVSAFTAHQEHDTKRWRQLMCLPLPKAALYLAKLAIVMLLSLLACLVVWAENIFWGWLFTRVRPDLGLSLETINLWRMLLPYLLIYLYSLLILAFHFWFSTRVHNFALSIGLGFALGLIGLFVHEIDGVRLVFPWALPSIIYARVSVFEGVAGLVYSLAGFAAITYAGCRSFLRRDVLE
ncbi:MAG: ABC transporter permease subunit [Chloroflexi bacterium]|jgi:hypothetical protein|nr:ABC transporter permease subunit [Chloroflexota bacterium]